MRTAEEWAVHKLTAAPGVPLVDFIRAIQRDAIESCAKVCDNHVDTRGISEVVRGDEETARECADRIRALLPTKPDRQGEKA